MKAIVPGARPIITAAALLPGKQGMQRPDSFL